MPEMPSWSEVRAGARPPEPENREPGEYKHGWQYHAMNTLNTHFVSHSLVPRLSRADAAVRLSSSGPCAGRHFTALPFSRETTFTPERYRALLCVRLRLDPPLAAFKCACGASLDAKGCPRSACSTVGVLVRRGVPPEIAMARICREAGARVQTNVMLRDLNVSVSPADTRKIEVIVNGAPCFGGMQLAVDTTLVSALRGNGCPRGPRAGQAIREAERAKHGRYPELDGQGRCKLIVVAMEVHGRWGHSAARLVQSLAKWKAQSMPRLLRRSAEHLWFSRWTSLLACATQQGYAASLLEQPLGESACVNGSEPVFVRVRVRLY